jgi:hypothetical protein
MGFLTKGKRNRERDKKDKVPEKSGGSLLQNPAGE